LDGVDETIEAIDGSTEMVDKKDSD
jgi:hypothetical protein